MHYKNGTEAKNGDAVILKRWNGDIGAGTLHSVNAGSTTCNGTVATPVPGGMLQEGVTIGEIYSAADAFAAMENLAAPKEEPDKG